MTKIDKIISKMHNNPRNWQISDLMVIANRFDIQVRNGKGSHVCFTHTKWIDILTIPAHRPIKPIYVKKFLSLIASLEAEEICE